VIIIGLLLLAGGLLGAACSSSDTEDLEARIAAVEGQHAALQTTLDELTASSQRSAMVGALTVLNGAGLHELDEVTNAGEDVPAGAAGGVDDAILAVLAVDWPDELSGSASGLVTALQELAASLEGADSATVAPLAAAAHDAWHDFDHEVVAHIGGEVGVPGEGEHEEGGSMEHEETETPTGQ
jgi:hypothetical protein